MRCIRCRLCRRIGTNIGALLCAYNLGKYAVCLHAYGVGWGGGGGGGGGGRGGGHGGGVGGGAYIFTVQTTVCSLWIVCNVSSCILHVGRQLVSHRPVRAQRAAVRVMPTQPAWMSQPAVARAPGSVTWDGRNRWRDKCPRRLPASDSRYPGAPVARPPVSAQTPARSPARPPASPPARQPVLPVSVAFFTREKPDGAA